MKEKISILGLVLLFSASIYAASDWTIQNGTNSIAGFDQYNNVWVNNSAELNMSGGHASNIYMNNSSTLQITGGEISYVRTQDSSVTSISDGDVAQIYCYNSSVLNVYGWSNSLHMPSGLHIVASDYSIVHIFQGNTKGQLNAYGNSEVHIYGENFSFQNSYLRGTWANGTDFSLYMRGQFELPSQLVLHEIPEPATIYIAGLGLLFLKKRRTF